MADRGFDIEEDLVLLGVKLNIPPFLRGKLQLSEKELIATRRLLPLMSSVAFNCPGMILGWSWNAFV